MEKKTTKPVVKKAPVSKPIKVAKALQAEAPRVEREFIPKNENEDITKPATVVAEPATFNPPQSYVAPKPSLLSRILKFLFGWI